MVFVFEGRIGEGNQEKGFPGMNPERNRKGWHGKAASPFCMVIMTDFLAIRGKPDLDYSLIWKWRSDFFG